jgi:hypothetical protein
MKWEPVKRNPRPAYPTRAELLAEGDLLERRLSPGWQKDLAGAAAFFLAINLTGCGDRPAAPPASPRATASAAMDEAGQLLLSSEAAAVVAPIFEHGEGRGATGCVVMNPPVFLSEEEAMQVIREELAKRGIELKADVTSGNLTIAPRSRQADENLHFKSVLKEQQELKPLTMDGVDELNRVAVKFISEKDCEELDRDGSFGTVFGYDSKALARHVAEQIKERGRRKVYTGVFYDPIVLLRFDLAEPLEGETSEERHSAFEKREQRLMAKSKGLVRQQAQDFVAWLQTQGVL